MSTYLATFVSLARFTPFPRYWLALASAAIATAFCIRIIERGRWSIGLVTSPRQMAIETLAGMALASAVILSADALIVLSTELRHVRGSGFPWSELGLVYLPAAVHEELVFRGYLFQRIRRWNRPAAIAITSVAFALLHGGNIGIDAIALLNLTVAGVLLAAAYERTCRLWFPIGIHFAWNVVSGPLLGFGVSGYASSRSLFALAGRGPEALTGGIFGVEASVWMLPLEVLAAMLLFRRERRHL